MDNVSGVEAQNVIRPKPADIPVAEPAVKPETPKMKFLTGKTGKVDKAVEASQEKVEKVQQDTEKRMEALKGAIGDLNIVMENFRKSIRFALYKQTDELYAQVINVDTNEVIKTVPSEEMLAVMERIDRMLGMFVDEES